jgi:hypothetical protein
MSAMTVFYQECPICGRSLRVPVKYFGRQMACSHCEGIFQAGKDQIARDEETPVAPCSAAELNVGSLMPEPQAR